VQFFRNGNDSEQKLILKSESEDAMLRYTSQWQWMSWPLKVIFLAVSIQNGTWCQGHTERLMIDARIILYSFTVA